MYCYFNIWPFDIFAVEDIPKEKMEKTTCFEDLPNEIIAKIMSHLTTKDLLINCALVCKTWNCFTKSPAVHRNITLPNCQNLVEFLNCATMLDSLCLKTSELDPNCDDALLAIRNWSNLSFYVKYFNCKMLA